MQLTNTRKIASDAKFYEAYSRYLDEENRYETWEESVDRVMGMHRDKYASVMNKELADAIDFAENYYKKQAILGAQRALQFGGEQLHKHNIRMFNCFARNTKFVTSSGVKSFMDFNSDDSVEVLTHTGKWKPAKVRQYGEQQLNKVTLQKMGATKEVQVTPNHRWLLMDSTTTTNLKEGDRLLRVPDIFNEFDWDKSTPQEKKYWCYGMVFGDGSMNGGYSHIRLCGEDAKFKNRFESMGFKTSTTESLKGDFFAYTGAYDKMPPNPEIDSPELIRAFVAGYLQADGIKNNNPKGKQYSGIQATGEKHIDFIEKCFAVAGVHITSSQDLTGQETNFGVRPYTKRFGTYEGCRSSQDKSWKVVSIEESTKETVWCLEVEDDKSFVLEGGVVTGNCVSSYCDRPHFFGEFMYMLLCGAGAGFSVQWHHMERLPDVTPRGKRAKTYVIEDSIEGWSHSIDVLLSSFFSERGVHPEYKGCHVSFDYSKIRPKGAYISGGFKAPSAEPLRLAHGKIEALLEKIISVRHQ